MPGAVYLIPTFLHADAPDTIPAYVLPAIKGCHAFFVENERSARRYLKSIWREMIIDDYQWFAIHKAEAVVQQQFLKLLKEGNNIAIISEAGCPGIADPGQVLVQAAQQMDIIVKPFVGPSSILLALMASGMNGQHFQFHGYLPIDNMARKNKIKELEAESATKKCTQLFIETPFRNNQLIQEILQSCKGSTLLCIATDITAPSEIIKTKSITQWKTNMPDYHKRLCIFLLQAL